jgi:hypothetical protein
MVRIFVLGWFGLVSFQTGKKDCPATMIDTETRRQLSADIRRLATGRMTNDEFDDVYYERYEHSDDRAVREIASHCYCLYNSDTLRPMRLCGRHSLDTEARSAIARCVLFLRSGLQYQWPETPDSPGLRLLWALAFSISLPGGIALMLICVPATICTPDTVTGTLAALGAIITIASGLFLWRWTWFMRDEWECYTSAGDHDVWPYLTAESFTTSRHRDFLLKP